MLVRIEKEPQSEEKQYGWHTQVFLVLYSKYGDNFLYPQMFLRRLDSTLDFARSLDQRADIIEEVRYFIIVVY